jgi:calcineurin-like phosphoesterase family protein
MFNTKTTHKTRELSLMEFNSLINKDTYIISDMHLGHKNILEFEPIRKKYMEKLGYETHEDMIIGEYNKVISKDDIVLHIGDFSFNSPAQWVEKLNGRKVIILGNHDSKGIESFGNVEYIFKGLFLEFNNKVFHTNLLSPIDNYKKDDLLSIVIKSFGDDIGYCGFSHYPSTGLNEFDRKNQNIYKRSKIAKEFFDENNVDNIFYGHVHSETIIPDANDYKNYYNVSAEVLEFKPRKIGSFLK